MDTATVVRMIGMMIILILAMLIYDQLNTTTVVLEEGDSFTLGSVLAVARLKFLLIGIIGLGSGIWASALEESAEFTRPKTVFEGLVSLASGIVFCFSTIVGIGSLALFSFSPLA